MDEASNAVYIEMLRGMKFGLNTKQYNLMIASFDKGKEWDLLSSCGSNWVGDAEKRINVAGLII